MKEQEWLMSNDHREMLFFLKGKVSVRKLQLYTCACCRLVRWFDRDVIEMIEGYADRRVKRKDAMAAVKAAIPKGYIDPYCSYLFWSDKCYYGADIASAFCVPHSVIPRRDEDSVEVKQSQEAYYAELLRCIIGNPFRPVVADPGWLIWHDGLVVSMARQMYDSRDFSDMPVLADALEEAGCDNADILAHCRSEGSHVRGCWVVDALLGKE
jgi:hypothetical protein